MMSHDDAREHMLTRQITCKAYRLKDGLWEIEGKVCDEVAHEIVFRSQPPLKAGEIMHLMMLTLIIDIDYTIQAARAKTSTAPYSECGETDAAYRKLIGLRIGPGFAQKVRKLLGGNLACTHITNLIREIANTYIQAAWPDRVAHQWTLSADPRDWPDQQVLGLVNQCHAWRQGGEALRNEFPELMENVPLPEK
jgi:hypothetical protein